MEKVDELIQAMKASKKNIHNRIKEVRRELAPRTMRDSQEGRRVCIDPVQDHHLGYGFMSHDRRTPSPKHGPEPRRTPPRSRSSVHSDGLEMRIPTRDGTPEFEDEDVDPKGNRRQRQLSDRRDPRDLEETALKSMRVEVPTFDKHLDPKYFLN